jgi:DNA-binding transcriptional LysR family regulator
VFENAMQGIEYTVSMELGHTEAIKKAVEEGLGISCLSRMAVQRELDNGWLVEVRTPLNLKRMLLILTGESSYKTRLFRAYMALLQSIDI